MRKLGLILLLIATFSFMVAVPREMVMVEIGTGTWCPYCPGASMAAHDLLTNGHNVAVIKNHNGDPYANTYSNARNSYYGISSFPTAKFDGILEVVGGSNTQSLYNSYLPKVNQRLAVPSHYTIVAGEGELNNGILTLPVTVTKVEDDTNTNVVLHSSITESNIAQNWQGQTRLDNVNRLMSPSVTGSPITLNTGESTTVNLTFNLSSQWQLPNLELVLWVQNRVSKEVLQAKKYSVPGITGAFPASVENLNFPDTFLGGVMTRPITFFNFSDTPVNATVLSDNIAFIPEISTLAIPALQSATLDVHFIPSSAGDIAGNLIVTGNFAGHDSVIIPLTGYAFVNVAPIAQDVALYGAPVYLQPLVGDYTFSDADGDAEGETTYKWFRIVNGNAVAINGADQITYTVQEADIGNPIAFGVIPMDIHGMPGEMAMSAPTVPIVNLPAPQNFAGVLLPPNTVQLTWERPPYFDRGFVGYRLFRNGLLISTITNTNVLSFNDTYLADGTYEYWVCSLFNNPMMLSEPSPSVFITVDSTSNEDQVNPATFSMTAMPNPFQTSAQLQMKSAPNSEIKLSVFNMRGQLVRAWTVNSDISGQAILTWDAKDAKGNRADSGIYLYKMESAGKSITGKLIKLAN
ncbi:MAG: Omp28-related outer membrane protein [Candidatus Cloacimonetes bacterium]|nr:Omp28-related outer membrane protein [Candidatus Cloacimonadota bacterium]